MKPYGVMTQNDKEILKITTKVLLPKMKFFFFTFTPPPLSFLG